MKNLFAVLLTSVLALAPLAQAKAATPLDLGGKATMLAGTGIILWDVIKVRAAKESVEVARKQLLSSQSYKGFAEAMKELKAANVELEALRLADPNGQSGAALARVVQAESVRNAFTKEILEDDLLRFDPLKEGRALPAGVEESRAKLVTELEASQGAAGKFSKLRRVAGVGLFVGGFVIVFMTVKESSPGLSPAAAFDGLPAEGQEEIAMQIEHFSGGHGDMTIDELFEQYR